MIFDTDVLICYLNGLVKTLFSRQDAKDAKKKIFLY